MLVAGSVFEDSEIAHQMPAVDGPPVELEPVTFMEWERKPLKLTRRQAADLEATGWLSVSPGPEDGCWKVTAKQWVGGFSVDGLKVIVRPKIKPENLFLLLEVGLPPDAWLPEAIDYAETDDLLAALISFFARTAETTLARGHYHAYRHEEADLRTLRGRLDFHLQFRRGGQLVPMACSYDDFIADVIENRYLKAAMQRAVQAPGVPVVDRRRIRRMLAALEDVADLPMEASAIDRVTFTRLNDHYLPAMRLARLILANLTLQDHHGDTSASAFVLDMNYLFERFVTERLRAELIGRLDVEAQLGSKLDTGGRVSIQPDLLFSRFGQCVGVADIKYKLSDNDETTDEVWARNADYYQLLAYTTALDQPGGTLIYCVDANETGDGNAADRFDSSTARLAKSSIEVRNVGTQLHAVGIDLSGSPQSIRDQITALADHLVGSLTEPETATVEVVTL